MTNSTPRVSVIIPAYNGDRYIVQAVESVISQTYTSWEIIIVDDGSTDNTRQVLQPYLDRIRYVYQQNQGVAAARNCGIREAQGQFIAFLDQDDFLLSDKLAAQVALFDAQPSLGIVNSGWRIVQEQGEIIFDIKPWENLPELDLKTWVVYLPLLPSAMMFSRQWLERVGGFDSQYDSVDDADLILRLALSGCEAVWLPQVTVCYRQHGQNVSIQRALKQANLSIILKQKFFSRADLPEEIRNLEKPAFYEALTWMAWQLYYSGYPAEMTKYLQKSLDYTPYSLKLTIVDWVNRLSGISNSYGCPIDGIALRKLLEWKDLIASILPAQKVRVSVVMPTYNCASYIVRSVQSAIDQTYQDWEIIIIDDGSTDNTRQVLAPYLDLIQYIYQDNQGVAIARNRGCELAKGEFLAFLDADDFFLPEKLEKQVACFDANPTLNLVQTGWLMVGKKDEGIYGVQPWKSAPKLDLETLILYKSVLSSAIMLRREWWKRLGGFDPRFSTSEDLDFVLRLALKGCKSVWLQEVLTCYRQHDKNMMSSGSHIIKNIEIVMEQFFAKLDLPQHIRNLKRIERYKSLVWIAWRMYRDGYLADMVECLEKSLYYSPFTGTETVFNWLENFRSLSQEYGSKLDTYELTNLKEWKNIVLVAANNTYQFEAAPSSIYCQHKAHVLLYTQDHGVGFLAQFNHSLMCKLVGDGYRVTSVQTKTSNHLTTEQQQRGIEHIWLEFDTIKEFSRMVYNLADSEKIYAESQPDLIIFSDAWEMANLAAKEVAIKQKIPYIISLGYGNTDRTYDVFQRGDEIPYLDAISYHYAFSRSVMKARTQELFSEKRMLQEYSKVIEQALLADHDRDQLCINPKVQKQMERVDNYLNYNYLVWKAWYAYDRGDISAMIKNLQSSLICTPFLTTETILNWLKRFVDFYGEKDIQLDTYALTQLESWQQLIELIQGFEVASSVR
jgi:glycosyltransferase involved in cell wall biosynthesis